MLTERAPPLWHPASLRPPFARRHQARSACPKQPQAFGDPPNDGEAQYQTAN
jgi:hypothetical protein